MSDDDGLGEINGAESKAEGLGMKLLLCQKGLKSCNIERVCGSDTGEKSPGGIGGKVAGAGDNMPGN